jgi:hypothetical protein
VAVAAALAAVVVAVHRQHALASRGLRWWRWRLGGGGSGGGESKGGDEGRR